MSNGAFYDDPNWLYGNPNLFYDAVPPNNSFPTSLFLLENGDHLLLENGDRVVLEDFGALDSKRNLWRFDVAWLGGLIWWSDTTGRTDADRVVGVTWSQGRKTLVQQSGKGLSRYTPGQMIVTLINDDFRYDPTNTSSILYPNVAPGVFCRLGVRRPQDDTYNWRFTGYITDVKCYQDPTTRANYCDLTISDGWSWFQNQNIYIPVSRIIQLTRLLILL